MAKPVIVVVDDEDDSLATLARELESRYGAHYLVVACASPGQALARLAELRAGGASVPLVLADQWMPELTGAELLAQVRDPVPDGPPGAADIAGRPVRHGRNRQCGRTGADRVPSAQAGWADLRRGDRGRRSGGPGRGCVRVVGGAAHRPAGAGGIRRPGRDQLADQELPRVSQRHQRGGTDRAGHPAGHAVRHRLRLRQPGDLAGRGRRVACRRARGRQPDPVPRRGYRHGRVVPAPSVPGLDSLTGAGVFYGAGTAEAQAVAGKPAFVVGGGNSAGQAALYLSKYARRVTILVRSHSLAASMSDYLIREIKNAPNIDVRFRTELAGGGGAGRLEYLQLRDKGSGETAREPAGGLFVLIGAEPFTGWLPGQVGRDQWGFILTGPDTGARWPLRRPPFLLETSMPGVFAVGDVRRGTVKRVASAVGEGSTAIRLIHEYLALGRE